jgi:antitoxin VapB
MTSHKTEPPISSASELEHKSERITAFLGRHHLAALLLSRHENIAWATAGQVEARVGLGSETAVAWLLITREGRRYYIAPNNEGPRLAAEEFCDLGYEPVLYAWNESAAPCIAKLTGSAPLGSDTPLPHATHIDLGPLRAPLLPEEIERYRILGRDTADAVTWVLKSLEPGISEYEMAARSASALLARGIAPTVLLMGAGDRIHKYKHAVPRHGVIDEYAMVNLCARRWGLVVSITRFVYFGSLPASLLASFRHVAHVNAQLLHATRTGATADGLYTVAANAYAAAGAPEEIALHHQGGPCGYVERDWLIAPGGQQAVNLPQAFAYNPSLRGAKVEDTVLVTNGGAEVLTATPSLPILETTIEGVSYHSAAVLEEG